MRQAVVCLFPWNLSPPNSLRPPHTHGCASWTRWLTPRAFPYGLTRRVHGVRGKHGSFSLNPEVDAYGGCFFLVTNHSR